MQVPHKLSSPTHLDALVWKGCLRVAKRREENKRLEKAGVIKSGTPSSSQGRSFLKEAAMEPGSNEGVVTMPLPVFLPASLGW